MAKPKKNTALEEAVSICETPSKLAALAEVSPQVINNARRRGTVSPELALAIECATNGRVAKERLVWGDEKKAA
jgi:DNA-binding transcriptional regulator YdaS (Cro superfamily)